MCWWAGGHGDAHQSRTLWLSLCNDLKQCMTMTVSNNVTPSKWHQQQSQTSQQLGKGVEWECLWTAPVAWLFLSCRQLLKGELPVLRSPKPSAVNISDDDNDWKPECSLKWLCNALTWICVVWKCGWASTQEHERVRVHVNVCEWPKHVPRTVHTCAYKSFDPLSFNTQETVQATYQVNIADTF